MNFSENDPRLTAYALGEIEDVKERKEIEAAIAESPELQKAVEDIRMMGALLEESLEAETAPDLSEFEKEKLTQDKPLVSRKKSIRDRIFSLPVMSAAAAVIIVTFIMVQVPISIITSDGPDLDDIAVSDLGPPEIEAQPLAPPPLPQEKPASNRRLKDVKEGTGKSSGPAPSLAEAEAQHVYELSPFAVEASDEKGYMSSNALAGGRLNTDIKNIGSSVSVVTQDFMEDVGAADGDHLLYLEEPKAEIYLADSAARKDIRRQREDWNTEQYDSIEESEFRSPLVAPLSTFSIDVDTASYSNVRRLLNSGVLPPANAVRIEELINYFPYADKPPTKSLEEGGDPFAVHMDQTVAPWNDSNHLLRIALKGYEMPWEERPASNLVFLLDVSGSMSDHNKLPLVQKSMNMLVNKLDDRDRVAIVVYAGASGLVLPSTTANNRETIEHAIRNLSAGGSTNAGAGIELAYKVARQNFIKEGNNRVILCTDGDFNVGRTDRGSLTAEAEAQAEKGVSLTILGFGMGNYKDGMLEALSNKGKGSYAYIDTEHEARKVFLQDLASNLFKIAKDVKIQVEFNPAEVTAYRLIGYENRRLKAEDFNNDKKKAGDIGPGHSVVALYEIVPESVEMGLPVVDGLKYQSIPRKDVRSNEVATVKLRYKLPEADESKLITHSVGSDNVVSFNSAPEDLRFSAGVAAFGMKLRKSRNLGEIEFAEIEQIATGAIGQDPGGHRSEFAGLVRKAAELFRISSPDKE